MRSAAKHRSDSAARSTPTRAQRGTRPSNSTAIHYIFIELKGSTFKYHIDKKLNLLF
ncbi:MAG: hypothetical protein NZ455_10530 [Bacteroidia bacterium]|nr:hypothetical protein [Bacteroidia bacterium]